MHQNSGRKSHRPRSQIARGARDEAPISPPNRNKIVAFERSNPACPDFGRALSGARHDACGGTPGILRRSICGEVSMKILVWAGVAAAASALAARVGTGVGARG